ncbi:MAG TPA: hypothetical protein VNV84_06415 [Candidatus Acidoferrales bacterium]|nr:hypothetical protein [Candidatus Acidoferrales bacterium]
MNANQHVSADGSIYPTGILAFAATLLILLGLALQAAEIGWIQMWPRNVWLFSVIVPGLWNMLAVQWNAPVWQELLKFWPLALVVTGLAMLLTRQQAYARVESGKARHRGKLDE